MLRVRLFGPFELRSDDEPVVLASARARSLLACLTLRPGPQPRDRIAALLWPDSTAGQARTNLRHVLHTLRTTVPDASRHLHTTAHTVELREAFSDVAEFDAADARTAADLYVGDLLDGCDEEWLLPFRADFHRRALSALDRLVTALESAGEINTALTYATRAHALDRLAEGPVRALMRLHDAHGERARAVRVFHECVAELGVPPSPDTQAVYESLVQKRSASPEDSAFIGRTAERRKIIEVFRVVSRAATSPTLVGGPHHRTRVRQNPSVIHSTGAHVVVLTGEPGIGKSRLADEIRQWAAQGGVNTATARSYEAEGAPAYAPIADWLRELGPSRWLPRLSDAHRTALAPLLPDLIAVAPETPQPGARIRLFDAIAHAVGDAPTLLVADDLHAADAPTLQFLHFLVRGKRPVLVIATARLDETDPDHPVHELLAGLRALGRVTELALSRLAPEETAALAAQLGVPNADRLHAETEGNPLFVVEALRAGWDAARPEVLTPRVQAVLEARLRPLGAGARELIAVAAVAGSAVPVDVLARVHADDAEQTARDLDEVWRRGLLRTGGGDTYEFSHGKLREVAYRAIAPARRRRLHRALAEALRDAYAGGPEAGRIAAHLHRAGATAEAADWYAIAATAAQRLFADTEAAGLLDQAWQLVRAEPSGPARDGRELAVLTALLGPLVAADGYGSARLRTVLDRALELAGDAEPSAPVLRAQAMAALSRGEFDAAGKVSAPNEDVVEGHFVRGVAAAWLDRNDEAAEHLEAAIVHYRPENREAHLRSFGQDPRVLCLVRLAHVRFRRGETVAALELRDRALTEARSIGHPFTLAGALLFSALLDLDRDDRPALRVRVAELDGLRARVDAAPIRVSAEALAGLVEVLDGGVRPGLARIDAALADPGRATAPGVPAMLLRIRLAATVAAGLTAESRDTARELLADDVRIWDDLARQVLAER